MENHYRASYQCVSDIHRETNKRIYERNIPSQMLQPYLDVRPTMSKYSYFPIVEPRKPINVPLVKMPTYNVNEVFNPGNRHSPWSGFASNINRETELRNQIYSLQKCSQAVYIPNSNSDLYMYKFQTKTQDIPHELLFRNDTFESFNPNPAPGLCGSGIFNNNTRCQIKDMTK